MGVWLEFDEDIDIALWSKILAQDGPKQGQTPNFVGTAKIDNAIVSRRSIPPLPFIKTLLSQTDGA